MSPSDSWPKELLAHLGKPSKIEPLFGQSDHRVWRVGDRVVKATKSPAEAAFYREAAPSWPEISRSTPGLEWSLERDDESWLVLEFVPEPLSSGRWLADPEVLAVLRRVHVSVPATTPKAVFHPAWPEEMSEDFLRWLPEVDRPLLDRLRERCLPLLEPRCWISGDPNPGNWGIRRSGDLVLFDWERFGRGTPALDLAITVPGLGSPEDFELVARTYGGPASLAEDIACAKAWSLVEFASQASQSESRQRTLQWVRPAVSDWLRSVPIETAI